MKSIDLDPKQLQIELRAMQVEDCISPDPNVRLASYESRLQSALKLYMGALEDHVYFRTYHDSAASGGEPVQDCKRSKPLGWRGPKSRAKTIAPTVDSAPEPSCGLCRACGNLAQDNLIIARQGFTSLLDIIAAMRAGMRLNAHERRIQHALDGTGEYPEYSINNEYEERHELED